MIKIMGWQITYIGLSDKNNKKSHLYKDMYKDVHLQERFGTGQLGRKEITVC